MWPGQPDAEGSWGSSEREVENSSVTPVAELRELALSIASQDLFITELTSC